MTPGFLLLEYTEEGRPRSGPSTPVGRRPRRVKSRTGVTGFRSVVLLVLGPDPGPRLGPGPGPGVGRKESDYLVVSVVWTEEGREVREVDRRD